MPLVIFTVHQRDENENITLTMLHYTLALDYSGQLAHIHANTVKRHFLRVIARNAAQERIQDTAASMLTAGLWSSANEQSLIGTATEDIPPRYRYFKVLAGSRTVYVYDIRELVHFMCAGTGAGADAFSCPYTNVPFSRYQRYFIIRKFYTERQKSGYEELVLTSPTHQQYEQCRQELNDLFSPYNSYDIETVGTRVLYDLIMELVKWTDQIRSTNLVSLAIYHWINGRGNKRTFRACCYLLLINLINSATDKTFTALRLATRIDCISNTYPSTDPANSNSARYLFPVAEHEPLMFLVPPQSLLFEDSDDGSGLDLAPALEPPRRRRRR